MEMSSREKYSALLEELSELLERKNTEIEFNKYLVAQLQEKLSAAEREIAELKGGAM